MGKDHKIGDGVYRVRDSICIIDWESVKKELHEIFGNPVSEVLDDLANSGVDLDNIHNSSQDLPLEILIIADVSCKHLSKMSENTDN